MAVVSSTFRDGFWRVSRPRGASNSAEECKEGKAQRRKSAKKEKRKEGKAQRRSTAVRIGISGIGHQCREHLAAVLEPWLDLRTNSKLEILISLAYGIFPEVYSLTQV